MKKKCIILKIVNVIVLIFFIVDQSVVDVFPLTIKLLKIFYQTMRERKALNDWQVGIIYPINKKGYSKYCTTFNLVLDEVVRRYEQKLTT